jgi:hypothetical protein
MSTGSAAGATGATTRTARTAGAATRTTRTAGTVGAPGRSTPAAIAAAALARTCWRARDHPTLTGRRHLPGRRVALEPRAPEAVVPTAAAPLATTRAVTPGAAAPFAAAIAAPGHEVDEVVEIALLLGVRRWVLAAEDAHESHVVDAIADHVERLDQARETIALKLQRLFQRGERRVGAEVDGRLGRSGLTGGGR